jgi:hypothetical protein
VSISLPSVTVRKFNHKENQNFIFRQLKIEVTGRPPGKHGTGLVLSDIAASSPQLAGGRNSSCKGGL